MIDAQMSSHNYQPGADVIIAAQNESLTIGEIVLAARRSVLVERVIVSVNGSSDATAQIASEAGADVISSPEPNKGAAILRAAQGGDSDIICTLDGDGRGLRTDHIDRLIKPVQTRHALMEAGVYPNPRNWMLLQADFLWPFSLTGYRAYPRSLLDGMPMDFGQNRYFESALNLHARRHGFDTEFFGLDGVRHVRRHAKPFPESRVDKSIDILKCYLNYATLLKHYKAEEQAESV